MKKRNEKFAKYMEKNFSNTSIFSDTSKMSQFLEGFRSSSNR